MEIEGSDAEISQHPRPGHDEQVGALQRPERFEPLDQLERQSDQRAPQPLQDAAPARGAGAELPGVAVRHEEGRDPVPRRRVMGIGADAVDPRVRRDPAEVLEDGLERVLVSQVLRPEVPEQRDRPRRHRESGPLAALRGSLPRKLATARRTASLSQTIARCPQRPSNTTTCARARRANSRAGAGSTTSSRCGTMTRSFARTAAAARSSDPPNGAETSWPAMARACRLKSSAILSSAQVVHRSRSAGEERGEPAMATALSTNSGCAVTQWNTCMPPAEVPTMAFRRDTPRTRVRSW